MAAITIRNLSDEVHRALKARAAEHGRSTEAELRSIIELAVFPPDRVEIGSELKAFGEKYGGLDLDLDREPEMPRAANFD